MVDGEKLLQTDPRAVVPHAHRAVDRGGRSLRSTGRRASDASIVNLVRRSGLLHRASTFVELS